MTTTTGVFSPGVFVSTGSLNLAVVPEGRSLKFAIESSAFGASPTLTVWSLAVGVYLSASLAAGVTKYAAVILSVDLSG